MSQGRLRQQQSRAVCRRGLNRLGYSVNLDARNLWRVDQDEQGLFSTPSQRSRSQKDDAECDPLRSSDCHHGDRSYNRQRLALRERTQQLFPFRHHRWARSSRVSGSVLGRLPALPAGVEAVFRVRASWRVRARTRRSPRRRRDLRQPGSICTGPGRSRAFTDHVYDVSCIVSCDAGRGEFRSSSPRFVLGRAARSFDVVNGRAQSSG